MLTPGVEAQVACHYEATILIRSSASVSSLTSNGTGIRLRYDRVSSSLIVPRHLKRNQKGIVATFDNVTL